MPLVKPKEKEKREDFIERCMGDKTSAEDYPSRNQRFAVCNSLYNERNKKEKITMEMVTIIVNINHHLFVALLAIHLSIMLE